MCGLRNKRRLCSDFYYRTIISSCPQLIWICDCLEHFITICPRFVGSRNNILRYRSVYSKSDNEKRYNTKNLFNWVICIFLLYQIANCNNHLVSRPWHFNKCTIILYETFGHFQKICNFKKNIDLFLIFEGYNFRKLCRLVCSLF